MAIGAKKEVLVGKKVLVLVLGAVVTFPAVNAAFRALNASSDVSVLAGVLALIALVVLWTVGVRRLFSSKGVGANTTRMMMLLAVLSSSGLLTGCTRIPPGYAGIEVDLSGSQRGVQDFTLKTGRVWYNPISTSIMEYPTFVQTAKWTKDLNEGKPVNEEITFTNKDSMLIAADVSLSYRIEADKVPNFYVKFRNDDINEFTHGYLRNVARDAFNETAGKYSIEQIMGDNGPFLAEVRKKLQGDVEPIGVKIEQFGFIGAPRPPQAVIDAINAKVEAVQSAIRTENQVREAEAEAKKRVATAEGEAKARIAIAEGEAKANQALTSSLTSNLILWRQLDVQEKALEKWNGELPQYNGGGAVPFIQVPQK